MDNPEKMAILGTQDTRHKTQEEDNQNQKTQNNMCCTSANKHK
jgi:hypothetical protein